MAIPTYEECMLPLMKIAEDGKEHLFREVTDALINQFNLTEKEKQELLPSGSIKEAATVVGKSGDEGIDGIIKEDKLGLDVIYIQAKKWDSGTIGRPEIQKFAGALLGKKAKKGIFITTSTFTNEAKKYVTDIDAKIILLDGKQLTELMIENNLGVSTQDVYTIKRIDSDYFEEN